MYCLLQNGQSLTTGQTNCKYTKKSKSTEIHFLLPTKNTKGNIPHDGIKQDNRSGLRRSIKHPTPSFRLLINHTLTIVRPLYMVKIWSKYRWCMVEVTLIWRSRSLPAPTLRLCFRQVRSVWFVDLGCLLWRSADPPQQAANIQIISYKPLNLYVIWRFKPPNSYIIWRLTIKRALFSMLFVWLKSVFPQTKEKAFSC